MKGSCMKISFNVYFPGYKQFYFMLGICILASGNQLSLYPIHVSYSKIHRRKQMTQNMDKVPVIVSE